MLNALVEVIVRFAMEFLFFTVLYGIGWAMLKVITFGRYPPKPPERHNENLVALFAVATFFVAITVAFS